MRGRIAILALLGLALALAICGCGSVAGTLGTAGPTSTSTTAAPTTAPAGSMSTDTTVRPVTTAADPGTSGPATTVASGTTLSAGDQKFELTFVGPMTSETWRALRAAVNKAADNGDKVRANVAELGAGPEVSIKTAEFDRFSGIGFTAGANTTQPIAIATDTDGNQVLVYSFTITGEPGSTTIVGFELQTGHVGLVKGPLKITDSTKNITTVPGQ